MSPLTQGVQRILHKCNPVLFHYSVHKLNTDPAAEGLWTHESFLVTSNEWPFSCNMLSSAWSCGSLAHALKALQRNRRLSGHFCSFKGFHTTDLWWEWSVQKMLLMATEDVQLHWCWRLEFFRQGDLRHERAEVKRLRRKFSSVASCLRISKCCRVVITFSKQFLVIYFQKKG